MNNLLPVLTLVIPLFTQCSQVAGTYVRSGKVNFPAGKFNQRIELNLQPDSSFFYQSRIYTQNKVIDSASFDGRWILKQDTIILLHNEVRERWVVKAGKLIKISPNGMPLVKLRRN